MPNHFETRVILTGSKEAIVSFKAQHFIQQGAELCFDMNTVIPMPKILEGTESSSVMPTTVDGLLAKIAEGTQDGVAYLKHLWALKETGCANWYTWCSSNWGTKWNAYDLVITNDQPKRLAFHFQTAWAPPTPVLAKLIAEHHELNFQMKGRDEFERKWTPISLED